jgi:5-methyltetrahydrofolate--homocysteine methyltransferase
MEYAELTDAILVGDANRVKVLTEKLLAEKKDPLDILNNGLIIGMNKVSKLFQENNMYIPEVLISSRAMHAAMHVLKPFLTKSKQILPGRIIIGTVAGDLHDIGKNLVVMMLRGKGFEVIDLGIDIPAERFVHEVKVKKPDILGLSALLTTTMPVIPKTIKLLKKEGLREHVKVMVGGGPLTRDYARAVGADAYGASAQAAVEVAEQLINSK